DSCAYGEARRGDWRGGGCGDQVSRARPQAPPPADGASPPGSPAGGGFNCYVPGRDADDYRKFGAGKLVPANTDISIQVHYTPIGKEVVDRPLIGFTVSDTAPAKRWMSYGITAGGAHFAVSPDEGAHKKPPREG